MFKVISGCLILLCCSMLVRKTQCSLDRKRAKITTNDGDLIIETPLNHDIILKTQGSGKLNYNNMDLSKLIGSVQNSFDGLQECKANIDVSRVNFKNIFTSIKLLGDSMKNMRNVTGNTTNYSSLLMFTRRRVNIIQRRLKTISMILLTNECGSSPCSNGGTCFDMYNTFFCQCPSNWEGTRCETDVNECAKFLGTELGCQNGATCYNKPGTYECVCADGWFGLHCTKRSADCSSGPEICGHGTCISQTTGIGYTCICDQGWKSDGVKPACTVDVNECESYKPPCSSNPPVTCVNLPGTFYCGHCPPGYTGNGFYCTDIDECAIFNGGCSLNPMVQCINTLGSRTCGLCPPGYIGNGMSCTYQGGACAVNNGGCHPNAQCRDNSRISSTYVECVCPSGYTGNGIGPFGCTVIPTDACHPNPCVHGECSLQGNSYACKCYKKYSGVNCNNLVNPCDSNPCQNGGTCRNLGYTFSCTCRGGFNGKMCDARADECGRVEGDSGTIEYPYPHQMYARNCTWLIVVPEAKAVKITFKTFEFKCGHNWLQTVDYTQVGRYCGTNFPRSGNFTTHDHIFRIEYRYGGLPPVPKFSLIWEATEPVCGGTINITAFGTFNSPGSPARYPNNRDCFWRFSAPLGKRIQFQFFSFDIGYNSDCDGDYLEFRQGLEVNDPVIAKYCNSTHPEPLFSTGHEVLVHFHSNNKDTYSGFQITYNVVEGIPGCGGIYTLEEGEISSPSISGEYPPNTLCEYKIKLPNLSKVLLTFTQLSMEYSTNCENDYLAIHDGRTVDAPLIGKFCGKKLPSQITSVSSEILIVFKSDFSQTDLGFKIQYKTVCGGVFANPSGVIHSPNYPYYQTIKSPRQCVYEITQNVDSVISLNITDMDFGDNTVDCNTGYLEVFDIDQGSKKSLGKFCKNGTMSIRSTHNYIMLKYVANFGKIKGFKLEYNAMSNNGCGGVLTNKFGTIESPLDLDAYQDGLKCIWALIAPTDYVVQLNWIKFNLEQSFSCVYDSVKVYDNATDPGSIIGTYCGSKLPPIILSSSNMMTIIFEVDNSNNQEGFLLSYTFVHDKNLCGGSYFTTSGIVKSPHYPDPYPINKDCIWVITVPSGQQIMLNFTVFDIESYLNCRYDYLEIRNGGTAASPLVGKYCGKNPPRGLISSHTNQLYLHFKSDMTKTAPGFQILWSSAATGCGGTLSSPNGMIISPHYPEPYGKNSECFWKISVSAGSIVQIVFADLDLEANPSCVLDYVEVYDGLGITAKSLGRYCAQGTDVPPFLRSTTNHMAIKFRSDLSFQGRGFQIQYSTICNNEVTGFWGAIESPNYPNNYPVGQNCLWKIGVPRGNKINITFTHFELGRIIQTNSCNFDYLQIYYSTEADDKKLKFCDTNVPTHLTIDSNSTELQLVSDKLFYGTGFRLEWNIFGCGGILNSPEGKISTPGYPSSYPSDTTCDWQIVTEYGSSVQINFEKIDMEKDSSCAYDFIAIYNGPDDKHPLLTQFCHSIISPVTLTSNGNAMLVRFQSDASYSGRGFEASYKTVPSKCGGTISTISGTIHSPNYPKNYDRNDSCVWLIQVHENHAINFTIEDMDFPRLYNKSGLKIYDGPTQAYPVLAVLYGQKKPNNSIISTTNNMLLEMITHPYFVTKGFLGKFHMTCGYVLTDKTGLISLNDHTLEQLDQKCSYTIKGEVPGERVFLTITHMIVFCGYENTTGIFVYEGMDTNSTLIGRYCGTSSPPTIASNGPNMHIEVVNDESNFEAHYTIMDSACGGVLNSMEGFITTPEFPNSYPVDTQCEWTIPISPGNKVQIEFRDFDIAVSDNCNEDYLEIREQDNAGKLLGVFCGTNTPTNIASTKGLWLFFKSAKPVAGAQPITAKGFKAEFEMVHGMIVNGTSGQIGSPLYPRGFKGIAFDDNTFRWTITVRTGYVIAFNFIDFNIDYTDDSGCAMASLNIFDGIDNDAPTLGTFCGTKLPENVETTSNVAVVLAQLDYARRQSKFLISWRQKYKDYATSHNRTAQRNPCGSDGVIDVSASGTYNLTSPNYPGRYWNYSSCYWQFSTTEDKHLAIEFKDINVRTIIPCIVGERISVYSMSQPDKDYLLQKRVCFMNRTSTNTVETSNMMKVILTTHRFARESNFTGFSAVVYEKCGGNLKGPNGIIEVKNASSFYSPHELALEECEWNVTVRSGRTIKVEFLNFHMGESDCNNYLMLVNGQFKDSPMLGAGKYCGNKNIDSLETSGNTLHVKFHSSFSRLNVAFKLRYSEVSTACGGKIILSAADNSTIISSPNYPNVPKAHTECEWIIVAPSGESIRLDFLEQFDLQISDTCATEVVEVRNGGTKYSPLIGRFCDTIPNTQLSYGNMMYIKYFTDEDFPKDGFKAEASIASCGGTLYFNGSITSPNFKNTKKYPANINCKWSLVGAKGSIMLLNFDTLDLPFSFLSNCSDIDHVTITEQDPVNNTERVIGEYCGKVAPKNIESLTNKVFVQFTTNKRPKLYNGFKLLFDETTSDCGGHITTEFGTISTPDYPVASDVSRNCLWTITVPKGRRIKLTFDDILLDKSFQFIQRGIAVFDGKMFSSPVTYLKTETNSPTIRSSDNTISVFFWSLYPSSNRGFRATYTSDEPTICLGNINEDNGVLRRPNATTFLCKWERNTPLIGRTMAFFVKGNFSNTHKSCPSESSYIQINGGAQVYVCKTSTVPFIFRTASASPIKLVAMLSKPQPAMSFEVSYKLYNCGGVVKNGSSVISSPSVNDTSLEGWECSWLLKPDASELISASFTSFDMGNACNKHYVIVYNGPTTGSPRIGKFCSTPPDNLKSTGPLLIEYHREKGSVGNGFKMTVETVTNGCGGVVHSQTTTIQTPSYPGNYPNNAECLWEIIVPLGYHINANFINRFQIESSDKCKNDFVMLYSNKEDETNDDLKQCGRDPLTRSVNSTNNHYFVLFRSNSQISGAGFKLQWKLICGGTFVATRTKQYIVSPGFPNAYDNQLLCVYKIVAPMASIKLDFEEFELEESVGCVDDSVTIRRRVFSSYRSKYRYCGTRKIPIIKDKNSIEFTFKTDKWITKKGFKVSYVIDECGGNITSPSIISYNDEGSFTYKVCVWTIQAPKNQRVTIRFTNVTVPTSWSCSSKHIEVSDDSGTLANICGKLTDSQLPVIHSNNRTVTVRLRLVFSRASFSAAVYFVPGPGQGCGADVYVKNNTEYLINSEHASSYDCIWKFTTDPDYTFKIEFLDSLTCSSANVVPSPNLGNCTCGLYEIRDGITSHSEMIANFCDFTSNTSTSYYTSGRYTFIRIVNAAALTHYPKISVKSIPSLCGPSILVATKEPKYLTTPNYPNGYEGGLKCVWQIKTYKLLSRVEIKFLDFDVNTENQKSNASCNGLDNLEIKSSAAGTSQAVSDIIFLSKNVPIYFRTYTFCSKEDTGLTFRSKSINTHLVFTSTFGKKNRKGIKMQYKISSCVQNITGLYGNIEMNGHANDENCSIYITAPKNYTVNLYFHNHYYFNLICNKSELVIREGDRYERELLKVCNYNIPSTYFSSSNKVHISITGAGKSTYFGMTYVASWKDKGCGGEFYGLEGTITSPLFPSSYSKDIKCEWILKAPQGRKVSVMFYSFDLQGTCEETNLTVDKGSDSIVFCPKVLPAVQTSDGNVMKVTYKNHPNNIGIGWKAKVYTSTDGDGVWNRLGRLPIL